VEKIGHDRRMFKMTGRIATRRYEKQLTSLPFPELNT